MKIEKASFTVESQLKPVIIHGFYYSPVVKANAKAVIQIAHGMAEHKERYDEFASFLAENGYAVFVHDHLGHGESVDSVDNLGFFGEEDGWKNLVNDCYTITKFAREVFPGKPVVLFGHSMGSFVARAYTQMYDMTLDAAIYCGTSGNNPAAGMGVKLADAIARSKGTKYKSPCTFHIAHLVHRLHINSGLHQIHIKITEGSHSATNILPQFVLKLSLISALQYNFT